jgi:hypothetical protein
LGLAFTGQPLGRPLYLAVVAGLLGLILCDAHLYPAKKKPVEWGGCAWVALLFVVIEQLFALAFAPSLVLHPGLMVQGFLLGMLTVSMIRVLVRGIPEPEKEPAEVVPDNWTTFITYTWVLAATAILWRNPLGNFIAHHGFPYPLAQLFPLVFFSGWYAQGNTIGGAHAAGLVCLLKQRKQVLVDLGKVTYSSQPPKSGGFPWPLSLELLSFALYLLLPFIALVLWRSGATESIDGGGGFYFASYCASALSLAVIWVAVRRMNQEQFDAIQKALTKEKEEEKKKVS